MHMVVFLREKELQAFDPPFDMSQNEDGDCHDCAEHMHGHNHADCAHSGERPDCSRSAVTVNNSTLHAQLDCPRDDAKSNECCGETGNKKASPHNPFLSVNIPCLDVKFSPELFRITLFLKKP
jgi:hypothetical protein